MSLSDSEIRRLAALLPSLARSINEFKRQQNALIRRAAPSIGLAASQLTEEIRQVESTVNQAAPQLEAALSLITPQLEALTALEDRWRRDATKAFEQVHRNALPPNLRSIYQEIDLNDVLDFVEEEGIPLYLVPRASTGRRLLLAKDRAARRNVLNRDFGYIVDDCAAVLAKCESPITSGARPFVEEGLAAIRSNHLAAAQALFTNVLDTLAQNTLSKDERGTILSHKEGKGPQAMDLQLREDYVMLPLWRSYEAYWPSNGDPIPSIYSRHASVHGVSTRQYSKRNTAQSLMLVTSYMGFVNGL